MLQNLSTLRIVLIGILACMILTIVFGAPGIAMEFLTLVFITAFWAWYFSARNSLSPWEILPVVVFVMVMYYVLFSGSLLWLMYLVICTFWYVLSDYFFPKVFARLQKWNPKDKDSIKLFAIIYFFMFPGMVFFYMISVLSTVFP